MLTLIHTHAGMYNCVSQVVYFHNPKYESRLQERNNIDAINKGSCEGVHILPCIMQIYPEIQVVYEGDDFGTNILEPDNKDNCDTWVVAGKKVYLLMRNGVLYYDKNLVSLLNLHIANKRSSDQINV